MEFQCPACHKSLRLKDDLAGRNIRCPACKEAVTVPAVAATPASPEPAHKSGPGRRAGRSGGRKAGRGRRAVPAQKSSTGLVIGAIVGLAALAAIGGLAIVLMGGSGPAQIAAEPMEGQNTASQTGATDALNNVASDVAAAQPQLRASGSNTASEPQAPTTANVNGGRTGDQPRTMGMLSGEGLLDDPGSRSTPSNSTATTGTTFTPRVPPATENTSAPAVVNTNGADVVVDAKLIHKSPLPTPAMDPAVMNYGEGLVMNKYEVTNVVSGELDAQQILVAHFGLKFRMVQPAAHFEVGETKRLSLKDYSTALGQADSLYVSDTTGDTTSPRFMDANQEIVQLDSGRWDYSLDITRVMRNYHLLRNQLKLVVLGDCQGWFSSHARLYFPEENQVTPVAINLTQERSCLSFYDTMVDEYCLRTPNLEWVVFAYHTRWVNGRNKWRGFGDFNNKFRRSKGFRFDQEHATEVFAAVDQPPITVDQIRALPEYGNKWNDAPWGELKRSSNSKPGGRKEAMNRKAKYSFSQQRWDQWEGMVKRLVDNKIRVLAYTLPVHPATGNRKVKDKNGTTEEGYMDQVRRMKEMEQKYPGYFFFYDYNNGGNNGLSDEDFVNVDHCNYTGAVKCTTAVNQYLQEIIRKHNIPTRKVTP